MNADERAASLMPKARSSVASWQAGKPPCDPDELESEAMAAIVDVLQKVDTISFNHARGAVYKTVHWRLNHWLRTRLGNPGVSVEAKSARQAVVFAGPMPTDRDSGGLIPVADRRADDPADLVAQHELIVLGRFGDLLPSPEAVKVRAAQLRMAMLSAVTPEDTAEIMRSMVGKAKRGSERAAQIVFSAVKGG